MSFILRDNHVAKILQANYDEIFTQEGECRLCLTKQQIDWILSQVEYARWPTRWQSPSQQEIDKNKIALFQADLITRLIDFCEDCDMPYLLRQNPVDPCQLEQSTNEGLTWSLAFDYRLCLFDDLVNPPLQRFEPVTGDLQYSIDDGETWVDAPKPQDKSPLTTDIYTDKDDPACWHTYNAVEVIRKMLMESGDELLIILTFLANMLLVIITGGALLPVALANLVSAILALGLGAIRAEMDATAWQLLREIVYCAHDEPSGWSFEAYGAIYDAIAENFSPGATVALQGMLSTIGYIGLNNAGHLYLVEAGDCSAFDCAEWWYEFDFTQSAFAAKGFTVDLGEYAAGIGYRVTADACQNASKCLQFGLDRHVEFPSTALLGYIIELEPLGSGNFYWSVYKGSGGAIDNHNGMVAATYDRSAVWGQSPSDMAWAMLWGMGNFDPVVCKRLVLHGTGVNPFGGTNYHYDPQNP